MPSYKFKVQDGNIGSEKIGAAVLADDDEAVGFAQRVIRELAHNDAIYTTGTMEITTGQAQSRLHHIRVYRAILWIVWMCPDPSTIAKFV